jgi:hypothetical protein
MVWFMISKVASSAALLLGLILMLAMTEFPAAAAEKVGIGLVEDIILLPWEIRLPARIDTGAAISSLDARGMIIRENRVEFRLPKKYSGKKLSLPIVDWQVARSSENREKRPVVELEICLASKRLRARFNLNDRSRVKYPVLIGRNILQENFSIDCTKSNCAPPSCRDITEK